MCCWSSTTNSTSCTWAPEWLYSSSRSPFTCGSAQAITATERRWNCLAWSLWVAADRGLVLAERHPVLRRGAWIAQDDVEHPAVPLVEPGVHRLGPLDLVADQP